MTELQHHTDIQEVRLQESNHSLSNRSAASAIDVVLQDELVDTCQAGGPHSSTCLKRRPSTSSPMLACLETKMRFRDLLLDKGHAT